MKNCSRYCNVSLKAILLLCAGAAVSIVSGALVGQYGFGLHPCELCILQRIPYAMIGIIGVFAAFLLKSRRLQFWAVVVCLLLFLVDAGIAGYHSGVELEIFKGPDACSSDLSGEKTLEQIRAEILGAPLVTCAQAMIYIGGLSMASWNMLAALACFFGFSWLLYKNRIL